MYWFGSETDNLEILFQDLEWRNLYAKREQLAQTPVDDIINFLDTFSHEWKPNSNNFKTALPKLIEESGFSEEETVKTLALLPELLKRENLLKRIKAEFAKSEVLDRFTKLPAQTALVKAVPVGTLLHVTAGNVFLSSIDSLIMGFLTKNLSILKVSGQNKFFPMFFAQRLHDFDQKNVLADKFSIFYWKGGEEKIEKLVKSKVDLIMAWGGEEMLASYRKDLPAHVKLLDFGPKISLQVISKEGLKDKDLAVVAQKIADDIIPWDQGACASPQNLYLEEGIDTDSLLSLVDAAFSKSKKRGSLSEDEATEILKETYRGYYSELMEDGKVLSSKESLIHLEKNSSLRPSPLNRSLIVKTFRDQYELKELLRPFSFYLQSCSYLLNPSEKDSYLTNLSMTGIKRFAPLGTITWGMEGAPHDGRFVLRELVSFIADERRGVDYGEDNFELTDSKKVKEFFQTAQHPQGYIFSSGGTTGEPKYVHFSYEEFDFMSDMLAENLKRQGIKEGMTVANLFVAGNLWSSFMCVEKALEKIGAIQLPIGGLCSNENIQMYLKKFTPDVVMGIPSMLVMNAEYMLQQNVELNIPMVFYAGESLSQVRREYLKKAWGTEFFGSAGYASVDAGVIGYQCRECGPGEHHVFSDLIDLKIVDEEAVVTSYARNSMPIHHYRTGDRIEWIPNCGCGSSDKRFKILGRVDNVIQIWSCRLLTNDVESVMNEMGIMTYQMNISEAREANILREKLDLKYESSEQLDREELLLKIYERSRDVKDTISFMQFRDDFLLSQVGPGEIPRNGRTGKVSQIIDRRR